MYIRSLFLEKGRDFTIEEGGKLIKDRLVLIGNA